MCLSGQISKNIKSTLQVKAILIFYDYSNIRGMDKYLSDDGGRWKDYIRPYLLDLFIFLLMM